MYYELGVVKKFQIPQEVWAGKSWDLLSWVYSRLAHAVAGPGVPVHAQHSSQNSHRTGFVGACREGVVCPETPHPAEGKEQSLMWDWSIKLASSALFFSSLPATGVGLLWGLYGWAVDSAKCFLHIQWHSQPQCKNTAPRSGVGTAYLCACFHCWSLYPAASSQNKLKHALASPFVFHLHANIDVPSFGAVGTSLSTGMAWPCGNKDPMSPDLGTHDFCNSNLMELCISAALLLPKGPLCTSCEVDFHLVGSGGNCRKSSHPGEAGWQWGGKWRAITSLLLTRRMSVSKLFQMSTPERLTPRRGVKSSDS